MERLTTRRKDGRWALKNDDGATPSEQINKIPLAIDRLAAYEDTGLEPECVAELAQAEKDGRVVVPCKVRDNDEGLKAKYIVHKAETGEEVNNCFVLRPDMDAAAVTAIRAYAAVTENKTLAADLIRWVGVEPNDPLTPEQLREMDGEPVFIKCLFNDELSSYVVVDKRRDSAGIFTRLFYASFDYYGDEWLAYRRKPEEVE